MPKGITESVIEEATGTSYTVKVSLSFPFYKDCIIIVGQN